MMQEFIVSTLNDENDGDFSEGDLSLREAIALANETEGEDTIVFDPSLNGGTITLVRDVPTRLSSLYANRPILIDDSVTIVGGDDITVDGDDGNNGIFILRNEDAEIDVTIEGLTIANGVQQVFSFPGLSNPGGSFSVGENVNFTLKDSLITGSSASIDGAIYNNGTVNIVNSAIENSSSRGDTTFSSNPSQINGIIVNNGNLTLTDSEIRDNNGTAITNLGNLEVDGSVLTNNSSTSGYAGGAIDNRSIAFIRNTIISGNSADVGSGISNSETGSLTLDRVTVEGNSSSSSDNSAIFSRGTTEINNSIIADHNGGSNVGIAVESGTTIIVSSSILNNVADQAQAGIIVSADGVAEITNSIIANNEARSNGGIENFGIVDLSNSTVVNNTGGLGGGGVRNFGTLNFTSNILANNSGTTVDLSGDGEFTSGGNNLVETNNNGIALLDSDLVNVDPNLGELADNGGDGLTFALLEGSPAIDAGSNPNNLEFDRRGAEFDRTSGNGTDIGAFEVQADDNNGGDGGNNSNSFVVSTLDDENDGNFSDGDLSLREAIALASVTDGKDIITFDSSLSGGIIDLNESLNRELIISDSIEIIGLGRDNLTLDGGFIFKLPEFTTELTIDGLNLVGSTFDSFGNLTVNNSNINQSIAINGSSDNSSIISRGSLNLSNSNVVESLGGDNLGVLIESGSADIINSTIADHQGELGGSGVLILTNETVNITNSTIAGNQNRFAAGIANAGGAEVNISNSTIVDNFGGLGNGGIQNSSGTVTLTSSLLSNNLGSENIGDLGSEGDYISGGNNLISNGGGTSSFINGVNGDLVGSEDSAIDSGLTSFQDNGGGVLTFGLSEDSPAIDAGSNPNNLEFDQRGAGFDRTSGSDTDIGAFEVQADDNNGGNGNNDNSFVVSTLDDENDGNFRDGDLSLREAIALASVTEGGDTITFDDSLTGGTISLNESLTRELIISDSIEIVGLGKDNLTLDGGFVFQLPEFTTELIIDGLNLVGSTFDSFGDLTVNNSNISQSIPLASSASDNSSIISRGSLNLFNSNVVDSDGGDNLGILIESGTADIDSSTIANHEGVLGGSGVLILTGDTVNITNSTIANNQNRFAGGIANAGGGEVNISNSTIADNVGGLGNGGIQNSSGTVTLTSSLLTNNRGGANIGDIAGDGEYISGGNNLISNGDDAEGFTNGVNGDIVGSNGDDPENPNNDLLIDPNLGELTDNGGDTLTYALLEGSPAIDAGSNPNNLEFDRRGEGFDRTVGNNTDIGAFEVQDSSNGDLFDETLIGTTDNDRLTGGDGNDLLDGGDGNDSLHGGAGDDLLIGGNGHDLLAGGEGNDRFVLTSNSGTDNIVDFSDGNDLLQLGEDLTFADLKIIGNSEGTGVVILDSTNHDAVIVSIDNVGLADITSHDFI